MDARTVSRIRGALLGGALGDAMGAPFEFARLEEIHVALGPEGISGPSPGARFTDDTQMTLFTCEALLISGALLEHRGVCHPPSELHHAYLRWLATQAEPLPAMSIDPAEPFGWLLDVELLHRRMAPGLTCLRALGSGASGTLSAPLNDSKGCGGVMRAAPGGFLVPGSPPGSSVAEAYHLGCEIAAVTHGHPEGIHSGGALAAIICGMFGGETLLGAVDTAASLSTRPVARLLQRALELAARDLVSPQILEDELGGGWVGEEALAIAVACAASAGSLVEGLVAAVNHSGDTDSTGSICGNLLGARDGVEAIPGPWLAALDGAWVVDEMAGDVVAWLSWRDAGADPPGDRWRGRYAPDGSDPGGQ